MTTPHTALCNMPLLPLLHVTWEGMIAANQAMCAAQEYPTWLVSLGSVGGENFIG